VRQALRDFIPFPAMNLTKYTVVTSDDFGKFEDRVNQLLSEGWQLQGGVASAPLPDSGNGVLHVQWSQALVLPAGAAVLEAEDEFAEAFPRDLESVVLPIEHSGDERTARRQRSGMPIAKGKTP
jgi:hypothetical protein